MTWNLSDFVEPDGDAVKTCSGDHMRDWNERRGRKSYFSHHEVAVGRLQWMMRRSDQILWRENRRGTWWQTVHATTSSLMWTQGVSIIWKSDSLWTCCMCYKQNPEEMKRGDENCRSRNTLREREKGHEEHPSEKSKWGLYIKWMVGTEGKKRNVGAIGGKSNGAEVCEGRGRKGEEERRQEI